ncbi:MAG: LacI family DNA-binding transcriptional regulator [Paenibacillus macerans]|nr:LacI family DNA-binding transcriptional regulator [Paenibacillus macerans]
MMKVSIYDVAHLAGVSISTVSRVLNRSGYVSKKTEKKVIDAMNKLNFVPNVVAQNLANSETKLIGLYFSMPLDSTRSLYSTYLLEFINGVNSVLVQHGFHLLLINETNEADRILANQTPPQYYAFIKQKRIDGLILGSAPIACSSLFELLTMQLPVVYIGEKLFDQAGMNVYARYKQYHREILDYFYERNHRRIAVLTAETAPIKPVIREFEAEHSGDDLIVKHFTYAGDLKSYLELIGTVFSQQGDKPTALLLDDISKAQQTINFLNNLGLDVPNDVSLITIEHSKNDGNQCVPAVTSVYVPVYRMAVEAATLLFEYFQGNQAANRKVIVNPTIIERNSVKTLTL